MSAAMALSVGGQLFLDAGLEVVVVVPAAGGEGDEADAAFDQAAGEQHALAGGGAAVFVLEGVRLGFEVEGLAGFLRGDELVGVLIEGVHRVDGIGFLQRAEMVVHGFQQRLAAGEAGFVHALGQVEIADLEIAFGGIRAEGEGAVGGGEVAGVRRIR